MTDRRVKECITSNPKTGISDDGTMHDGVYRPWIFVYYDMALDELMEKHDLNELYPCLILPSTEGTIVINKHYITNIEEVEE